jgi:hypothetical protein
MPLPYIPPCTITPTAEISAVHDSQSRMIEYQIEPVEIDHGYGEGQCDTTPLENRYTTGQIPQLFLDLQIGLPWG